ncbi:hypothetical protein EJ110_NYTH56285 [Nymphaea thermarum]|nr:hypothetical protein EJ110_NYTH56285 [Nymphaea thermarum]
MTMESSVKGWRLLALVVSAGQSLSEAEIVVNLALDETVELDHIGLLRLKCKLQIAQGRPTQAIETLLNPSMFAGWFGRSLFHALVVFIISIHVYADDKREMEELSMVALSGCIWLQAFVVTMETKQPSYWFAMLLVVVSGMGPVHALKYFRYTYRSSAINILQQAEYSRSRTSALANIEHPLRVIEKEVSPLSTPQSKSRASVYEPLLHDSPSAVRRSLGSSTAFELFQSPSRLSSSYSRNCKDN